MKHKLLIPTSKNIENKLELINQKIEKLKKLIYKIDNNTLTDEELYQEIIKLYNIAEGKNGIIKIFLESNKYKFQYLKTNITIVNKISNQTLYYPCIIKVALTNSLNQEHYYTLYEIINLINTRQIVLWDIVWPNTTFDPNKTYTKDINEGYTDFNLYKCIYPNHNETAQKDKLDIFANKYLIQNQKLKTLKRTNPEQYNWVLNYIKKNFTKTKLEIDKRKLEIQLKNYLESYKETLNSETTSKKKKTLSKKST